MHQNRKQNKKSENNQSGAIEAGDHQGGSGGTGAEITERSTTGFLAIKGQAESSHIAFMAMTGQSEGSPVASLAMAEPAESS